MKPSPSGGGESRDIFGAEGSGLPGHHRIAQPPGGFCHEIFGSEYNGLPSHHRIAQPPGGHCHQLFESEYSGLPSHQRVLKPPGGGSSDIFGSDPVGQPIRRNRNQSQFQSSVFTNMMETTSSKNKSGNDSHNRLFGGSTPTPNRASIYPENNTAVSSESSSVSDDVAGIAESTVRSQDGNPVTGEGYAIANGVKEIAASNGTAQPIVHDIPITIASAPKTNGVAKSAPPSRPAGRVPPGGFSSGLW